MKCQISEPARQDISDIADRSLAQFGTTQTVSMLEAIDSALDMLAEEPGIGHVREDLSPPDRRLRYWTVLRRFVIVYRDDVAPIEILRVLHGSRDLRNILSRGNT